MYTIYIYLGKKYLFSCSGSVKVNLFRKKSRKRRKSALQTDESELENCSEISDQSVADFDDLCDEENRGKKGQEEPSASNTVTEKTIERKHESTFLVDVEEAARKKANSLEKIKKSSKKDNVKAERDALPTSGTLDDISPEDSREKKNEVKNRDAIAAESIGGVGSDRHPKDPIHSPENDDEEVDGDGQSVTPHPVTEKPKMSEGVGKMPELRASSSETNEMDAKVESSSHDASDSFDNIEIPNNGKDFDQNSLLPDEDTEKKGVSKSLNSNNGKDGFAPENDSLDTFPQDTDRFERKDVCLASLGEKTDPDSDGVFTPLESENGDDPENNPKNCIISSDDDENATENRHTKMMGKHGFDPLLAPQNERNDQYQRDADAFDCDFGEFFADSMILPLPSDGSTDTTYQVTSSTIIPENVAEVQKGIVHPLSDSDSSEAIGKKVDKIIGTLSLGDENNCVKLLSDSICSKLDNGAPENQTSDSMELYRLRKDYSGNVDSSTEVSATTGSSGEEYTVSEETK